MNPFTRYLNRRYQAGMSLIEVLIASLLIFFIFLSILPLFARAKMSNRRGGESSQMNSFLTANVEAVNQSSLNHASFNGQFNSQEELAQIDKDNQDQQGVDPLEENAIKLDEPFYYSDTTNYIGLPTTYYGTGTPEGTYTPTSTPSTPSTVASSSSEGGGSVADAVLGDEVWLDRKGAEEHTGNLLWMKDILLFSWDLSDVSLGTVSVDSLNDDGTPADTSIVTVGNRRLFDNPLVWSQDNPPDIREVRVMIRSAVSSSPIGTGPAMVLGYYRSF